MNISIFKIEKEEEYLKYKNNIDINETNIDGRNALCCSSKEKTEWLIKHGIDTTVIDKEGCSLIFYKNKNLLTKEIITKLNLDINHLDNEGRSSLYYHTPQIFKLIISLGFDFRKHKDLSYLSYSQTRLLLRELPFEILKELKINQELDNKKVSLLFDNNHITDEKYEWLINQGVDINNLNKDKRNALFFADLNKTKILVKYGIDLNQVDKYGKNILFYIKDINKLKFICDFNIKEVISKREKKNVLYSYTGEEIDVLMNSKSAFSKESLNIKNDNNENLLFFSDLEKTKILLKHGININNRSKSGDTALFQSNYEKSKLLIENGIDVNIINSKKETALFYSNYEKSKLLIENGININIISNTNKNALFNADYNTSKLLIENGIKVDLICSKKETALFNAGYEKSKLLIENGININVINTKNENALFYSDYEKSLLLINSGIQLDIVNNKGLNLLLIKKEEDLIELLIKEGLEISKEMLVQCKKLNIKNDEIKRIQLKVEKNKLSNLLKEKDYENYHKKRI